VAAFFARETCETCPICVTGTSRLAELLRPGAGRQLAAAEGAEITAVAAEHRGKGICTLLDSAAGMAMACAPDVVGGEQAAAPVV